MNRLFIVGAGDFGREVLDWALAVPAAERDWEVAGFLDSRPNALAGKAPAVGILGSPDKWTVEPSHRFVIAVGDPRAKMKYAELLKAKGAQFASVIHPTVTMGSDCRLGEGVILCPRALLTTGVVLGNHVTLNCHATVGHDAVIGDGSTLSAHCDVTGHAKLGRGVLMGTHACVLPGAVVGDFAVVGAGSVVLKRVPPFTTVMGVPAKQILTNKQ